MGNLNLMNVVVGIVLVFLFGVVIFVPSEDYNEVTGEVVNINAGCGLVGYRNGQPLPICRDGEYCLSSYDMYDVIVYGNFGGRAVIRREDIGTSCVQGRPAPCVDSDSSGRSEPDSSDASLLVGGSASVVSEVTGEAVDHNDITYARYRFYAPDTKVDSCRGRNTLREVYCAAGRIPVEVDVTCPDGKICVTEGDSARCAVDPNAVTVNQESRSNIRSTASSRRSTSNLRQTIVRGSRRAASRRT